MRTKAMFLSLALAMPAVCFATNPQGEQQAVEQASDQFYTSLNAMLKGDVEPMKEVWSHADDVTYMGPAGGFQIGWQEIEANWEQQSGKKYGGKIEAEDVHITVGDNLAVVQCYERGNNLDNQGQPVKVSIRATNVFRKENGQWKLIGHHTDIIPILAKQSLTSSKD
jgi:ketosteroid isomerase-like protein